MQVLKHVFASGAYNKDSQYKPEMGSFYGSSSSSLPIIRSARLRPSCLRSLGPLTDIKVQTLDGKDTDLKALAGGQARTFVGWHVALATVWRSHDVVCMRQVSLVTNVACACGYTKGSYPKMVDFFNSYKDQGRVLLYVSADAHVVYAAS